MPRTIYSKGYRKGETLYILQPDPVALPVKLPDPYTMSERARPLDLPVQCSCAICARIRVLEAS